MSKKLPTPDLSTSSLFDLPHEIVKWQLMKTAIELKIFDCLSSLKSVADVSAELATDPVNTEFILNSLVALGCLVKEGGKFQNTPSAEDCWTTGKETSLGESFLFMSKWNEPMLNDGMTDLVKNGAPPPIKISDDKIWKHAAYASLNHTRCARAGAIAKIVAALPEFSGFSKILDLGAGPGIIGVAIALECDSLECVLFDQSTVCDIAEDVIEEYEVGERSKVIRGDYMNDPIGNEYDFVIANYTLNFYRDNIRAIIKKVYDSLNPGGVFMVCSDGMDPDKTAPLGTVISWLPTSLQGMSMEFTKGEIAQAMLDVGFVSTARNSINSIPLEAHGPIEITIGRK